MDTDKKKFFSQVTSFLQDEIDPISNLLDNDEAELERTYHSLIALGNLGLLIPTPQGGLGGTRNDWIKHNIALAQYSGALLFLQAQHQFAISRLIKLLPNHKVESLLAERITTKQGLAISLAANRNLLTVKQHNHQFYLSGTLRWVTGYQYYLDILLSFDFNNHIYYVLIPFENSRKQESNISLSEKIQTAVFNSTNTVSITLENWSISEDDIIAMERYSPSPPVEHPAIYNFAGAAKALLNIIQHSKYSYQSLVKKNHTYLSEAWENYHQKILAGNTNPLQLRAEGLSLVENIEKLARVSCGAAGMISSHPINRISREIWHYTIAGYSEAQVEAYLTHSMPQS